MITPLTAGEVDIALIRRLARISPLALDVQGFVRVRRENRLVFRDWQEKTDCLPLIRFLKMDQVEGEELTGLIDPAEAVRAVVDMGASEVMITYRGGVLVYSDGQYHRAAVSSPVGNGRTGRGDTCFATYVGLRLALACGKGHPMGRCVTRPEDEAAWSLFGYSDGRRTKTDGAEAGRPHLTEPVAARLRRRFRIPQHRNSYVVLFPISVKTVKRCNVYR